MLPFDLDLDLDRLALPFLSDESFPVAPLLSFFDGEGLSLPLPFPKIYEYGRFVKRAISTQRSPYSKWLKPFQTNGYIFKIPRQKE